MFEHFLYRCCAQPTDRPSVYSRTTNAIIRDEVEAAGGEIAGEEYVLPDSTEVIRVVRTIARSKPDLIFNSLVGDMNVF
jgi:urea transport system substrate-binding protein